MLASGIQTLLRKVGELGCDHQWLRARWADGSYGLRCGRCCKKHPQTFTALIRQPVPRPGALLTWPANQTAWIGSQRQISNT